MKSRRAKGGQTTKARYGVAFCLLCHRPLDSPYFAELGAKGGNALLAKRGREWMSQIGKLGGRPRRRRSEATTESTTTS